MQPLRIQVYDNAQNFSKRTFYIGPGSPFISTLPDTLAATSDSAIGIPVANIYAGLTPGRFYWDIDSDGSWDMKAAAGGMEYATRNFALSLLSLADESDGRDRLPERDHRARKVLHAHHKPYPVTLAADCVSPCSDTISSSHTNSAGTRDGCGRRFRPLQSIIPAGASPFPDSEWVYAASAAGTSVTVSGLPSGSPALVVLASMTAAAFPPSGIRRSSFTYRGAMTNLIRIVLSFFLASRLISCGDDYRADVDTGKKLTQTLYVIP